MLIHLGGDDPLHRQIYQAIRVKILSGALAPDTRLPSSRNLARELCVSRNVVLIAYDNLIAEGYLESRHGSGTYIATIPESYLASHADPRPHASAVRARPRLSDYARRLGDRLPEPPHRIGETRSKTRYDFRYGHPAIDLMAHRTWRRLIGRRAARLSIDDMGYGPPEGHPALRTAVAGYLRESRGVECEPGQIIIVNGSQQALDLVARVLVNPGDVVAIEEPCYPGMRQVLRGIGAKVRPVRVDAEGLVIEDLLAMTAPPRLICVTPSHQYPTGSVMSLARRLALVGYARRTNSFVLEDDYDSEFRYDTRPEKSMQGLDPGGRVIYVSTFSKVLFPALRVGYVVLPQELVVPFAVAKSVTDRYTATFLQGVLADFIADGHFDRHLRRVRRAVGERRRALIGALTDGFGDTIEISGESAGVHVLVRFLGLSRKELEAGVARAAGLGVGAYPVDACYVVPPRIPGLVIGYASMPIRQIQEGVRRLVRALAPAARQSGTSR
jgi:GntR family transcriptional regulator/MocR family aminotransferase